MTSIPYPSDLTNREWQLLAPLIPPAKPGGHPRTVNLRQMLNGIFYVLRAGCAWRLLPRDYGPWSRVSDYFRTWRKDEPLGAPPHHVAGTGAHARWAAAHPQRGHPGRASRSRPPSAAARRATMAPKSCRDANAISWWILWAGCVIVVVHPADRQDREGAKLVLATLSAVYPRMEKVWADQA